MEHSTTLQTELRTIVRRSHAPSIRTSKQDFDDTHFTLIFSLKDSRSDQPRWSNAGSKFGTLSITTHHLLYAEHRCDTISRLKPLQVRWVILPDSIAEVDSKESYQDISSEDDVVPVVGFAKLVFCVSTFYALDLDLFRLRCQWISVQKMYVRVELRGTCVVFERCTYCDTPTYCPIWYATQTSQRKCSASIFILVSLVTEFLCVNLTTFCSSPCDKVRLWYAMLLVFCQSLSDCRYLWDLFALGLLRQLLVTYY